MSKMRMSAGDSSNIHPDFGRIGSATHAKVVKGTAFGIPVNFKNENYKQSSAEDDYTKGRTRSAKERLNRVNTGLPKSANPKLEAAKKKYNQGGN